MLRISIVSLLVLLLAACGSPDGQITGRWYSQTQVSEGERLYRENCIGCHREGAVGTAQWKKRDADGNLPPPPLNGSAHAWHHDLPLLLRIIERGGAPFRGVMPAFADKLDGAQRKAVIAYIQSLWPDDVYRSWSER